MPKAVKRTSIDDYFHGQGYSPPSDAKGAGAIANSLRSIITINIPIYHH